MMPSSSGTVLHLGAADLAVLGAYFALALYIGWRLSRQSHGAEGFMLAGRGLTLPLFVGSLVATWYGGLLGVGEIAYSDGLVNWLTQGGFWYVTYLIFAFGLAGRLNLSGHTTLPDLMGALHGPGARLAAMLLNFVNVVPVAYLLSLGLIVQLITNWPLWLCIMTGTAVMGIYSLLGGFRAVVYTDMMQFGIMCLAVALVIPYAVFGLGGGDYLQARLPEQHLRISGSYSMQELAVWALIALSTLVDPNFYHRCYAAQSPKVARTGILLAIGFWILFDVCTTFGGLYARAALPAVDPKMAYPLLADMLLPAGLKGVFVAGVLATAMSTVDSYCFVGAMSLSHDLLQKTLNLRLQDRAMVAFTRLGILLTGVLAMCLALVFPESIKAIWKTMGSLSTSAVLVPMVLGMLGWRPPGAGVGAIMGGIGGTLGWAGLRRWGGPWALRVEVLIPGLACSITAYCLMGLRAALCRDQRRGG